jgi:hypothetical protein
MTIVGVTLVAALNAVGAARLTQTKGLHRQQAHLTAEALLAEIAALPYEDAEDIAAGTPGPSPGETIGPNRVGFDDMNDYAGWAAAPPQRKDGTPLPGGTGWSEAVKLTYLDPADMSEVNGTNPGITVATVTLSYNGAAQAELTGLFTRGLPATEACCMPDDSCSNMRRRAAPPAARGRTARRKPAPPGCSGTGRWTRAAARSRPTAAAPAMMARWSTARRSSPGGSATRCRWTARMITCGSTTRLSSRSPTR